MSKTIGGKGGSGKGKLEVGKGKSED